MLLSIYVSLGFVAALAVVSLLTLIRLWRVSSEPVVIIGSVPIDFIEKWSYGFPVLVGVCSAAYYILSIPEVSLLYGFLAGLYILRYFVLGIFQRIPTQPSFSYLLKSLSLLLIAIGAGSGYIALVGLTVLGLSMISLRKWSRHSVEQYDGWIKKRAAHIYHRHKVVFMNYHIQTQYVGLLITVTEDIARPSFSRLMERLYFCVKKPKTITSGVMQVSAKKILSDRESIEKGLEIVEDLLRNKPHDLNHKEDLEYVASIYNGNKFYARFLESSEPGVHAYWKNERLSSL